MTGGPPVMVPGHLPATADVVVVGGGTLGGWCAHFLHQLGAGRVVVIERGILGGGASSRAAGVVRAQGGTPEAVRLGMWSQEFYRTQHDTLGVDSGFVEQGYFLPAFTAADVDAAQARMAMQRSLGLDVRWLDQAAADRRNPTLTPDRCLGGTYYARDGYLDPPRNVVAYTMALVRDGVQVAERTAFVGVDRDAGGSVCGVRTTAGTIATRQVILTGGPDLAGLGALVGVRIPVGRVRHQVAVTQAHTDLDPGSGDTRLPMVFDLSLGVYWRPEGGGLLFGMSNPDEPEGEAHDVDWAYLDLVRKRLADMVPVTRELGLTKVWSATIEYTADHLPLIGAPQDEDGPVAGLTVTCAGGHGMMCGPAIARATADLVVTGSSEVVDLTRLRLDRFDGRGHSSVAVDPIALPFPSAVVGY